MGSASWAHLTWQRRAWLVVGYAVGHVTLAKPVCPLSELQVECLEKPEGGVTGALEAQALLALKTCVCCSSKGRNADVLWTQGE